MRAFGRYRTGPEKDPGRWAFRGSEQRQLTDLFRLRCAEERPIVLPDERIAFMRSRKSLARCNGDTSAVARFFRRVLSIPGRIARKFLPKKVEPNGEWSVKRTVYNTTPDYALLLQGGLNGRIALAEEKLVTATSEKSRDFLQCSIDAMEAVLELVRRYADEAKRVGNDEIAVLLRQVPAERPTSFQGALQAVRILQFAFYLHGMEHCGLGRMDQYLWPFYAADCEAGKLSRDQARELLEEFFISLNRDSDLYPGVQQGDNGQSLMLGGCVPETGLSAVNELTYLIIEASREVRLIDPKINLRVDRNTPVDLLELGSELTKCGLGFPQYSNDEVVIPALVKKGYKLEDARDYSVAACWEYVIPGKAMDMVNQGGVSFPYAVDQALRAEVKTGTFDEQSFRQRIEEDIRRQTLSVVSAKEIWHPAPFLSAFFDGALESGCDITECSPYKNIGVQGVAAANAADALAAIGQVYATNGFAGLKQLVQAQDADFKGFESLQERLVHEMPKVGNDDERADREMTWLFKVFADAAEALETEQRRVRPGSGSAMYYVWFADTRLSAANGGGPMVGATSDGRHRDAPFGSSLAPSQEAKVKGILSVFKSFAKIDYSRIINGGPLTVEFDHSVFKTDEGVKKLAQLIRYFVQLGGQQLQLNVLNVEELEDALQHPERHRNLVVRVWGWSGYFCELDREYQMQIIKRHRYGV